MRRKKRKWDDSHVEDPAAGLLNLFDVWIAFAAALLLASVSYNRIAGKPGTSSSQAPNMEELKSRLQQAIHYHASERQAGGDGERLGIAYRLKSGEVIYVPESTPTPPEPK